MSTELLDGATSLDDADQDHRDRDEQQQMDEAAQGVRADHPDRPQHEKDHEDRPQHIVVLRVLSSSVLPLRRRGINARYVTASAEEANCLNPRHMSADSASANANAIEIRSGLLGRSTSIRPSEGGILPIDRRRFSGTALAR